MPNRAIPSTFRRWPKARSSFRAWAQVQARPPLLWRERGLKCTVRVEEDRDRAFIDQLHRHHGLKNSRCHTYAQFSECLAKFFIQTLGEFWRCSRDEAWSPLPPSVAVESKL